MVVLLGGCTRTLERLPFVYRIDIQQGNVVTQEQIDQLRPGMTREQVRYLLGTPLVQDTFHPERWDYVYYFKPGRGKARETRVTLFFEGDRLHEIRGDLRPRPNATPVSHKRTVVVPPHERKPEGLLSRLWHWITFRHRGKH